MEFIPYGRQSIDDKDIRSVVAVLQSDYLTQGPCVDQFEQAICRLTGAKYCVAVSNGTAALHLAVLAAGLRPGDEGITSPITFVASANAIVYAGGKPIFADIRPDTYTIDVEDVLKRITARTKIIIPVDFAGQPAHMEEISAIARERNILVVEDAAHAIGSRYAGDCPVGSCRYSDMTTFSFHPVKTITTGEGGAVTTNNEDLYQKLRMLRTHGITKDANKVKDNPGPWYYEMQTLGFNYRMTDMQASLGVSQLRKLDAFARRRREIVRIYNDAFSGLGFLKVPFERPDVFSAFHLYILLVDFEKIGKARRQAFEELRAKGIGAQVHYIPVHLQPYYQEHFGHRAGDLPKAEDYYSRCISLPLYPAMTSNDVDRVIDAVSALGE